MDAENIKQLAEITKHYADKILSSPLEELGGLLGDRVGYWRLKNRVNYLTKAKKLLEDNHIDPKKILPDIFVPMLEEAGNTENEDFQEMFASLLANQIRSDSDIYIHPSYSKVIGQLSPDDAKILNYCYDYILNDIEFNKSQNREGRNVYHYDFTLRMLSPYFKNNIEMIKSCFLNLERLGILLIEERDKHGHYHDDSSLKAKFSQFGYNFIQSCHFYPKTVN